MLPICCRPIVKNCLVSDGLAALLEILLHLPSTNNPDIYQHLVQQGIPGIQWCGLVEKTHFEVHCHALFNIIPDSLSLVLRTRFQLLVALQRFSHFFEAPAIHHTWNRDVSLIATRSLVERQKSMFGFFRLTNRHSALIDATLSPIVLLQWQLNLPGWISLVQVLLVAPSFIRICSSNSDAMIHLASIKLDICSTAMTENHERAALSELCDKSKQKSIWTFNVRNWFCVFLDVEWLPLGPSQDQWTFCTIQRQIVPETRCRFFSTGKELKTTPYTWLTVTRTRIPTWGDISMKWCQTPKRRNTSRKKFCAKPQLAMHASCSPSLTFQTKRRTSTKICTRWVREKHHLLLLVADARWDNPNLVLQTVVAILRVRDFNCGIFNASPNCAPACRAHQQSASRFHLNLCWSRAVIPISLLMGHVTRYLSNEMSCGLVEIK